MPVARVRRSHVQAWVNGLADGTGAVSGKSLAPMSVRSLLKHLQTVLHQAVFDGLIPESPAKRIHTEAVSGKVDPDRIPTPEQVADLIRAAGNLQRGNAPAIVTALAGTGLRVSELCGLRKGDVEFLQRRIQVRRQMGVDRTSGPLKTLASRRTVPLLQDVSMALAPLCAGRADESIFLRPDGQPMTRVDVESNFASLRWSTGIAVTPHSMRHFFASGLIAAGVDVRSVQAALGHASATVTLSTYAHLWPDSADRVARAGEDLMCTLRALDGVNADGVDGNVQVSE